MMNDRVCECCGLPIYRRWTHAKYCQACADEKYAKRRGKRKTYKRIDFVEEFAGIVEYCLS